jgi:hypothetical protein
MTTPYRPSNGTEGEIFRCQFCNHCQRDEAFQADPENADGCEILAATFRYAVTDPDYPKEWTHDAGGRPTCTAFRRIGLPEPRDENASVRDLFA